MIVKKSVLVTLALFLVLVQTAAAHAYGTSGISLTQDIAYLTASSGTSVNYTINLVGGNTGATTLILVNGSQLASNGITVSFSKPSDDPPFSGTMNIQTLPSTPAAMYTIVIAATGGDPSAANATFELSVAASPQTTAIQIQTVNVSSSNSTTTAQAQSTTVAATTVYPVSSLPTGNPTSAFPLVVMIAIVVVVIIAALLYYMRRMSAKSSKASK